jgi:hypothetical protein
LANSDFERVITRCGGFFSRIDPCATVDKVAEEASFVLQVEKQRISIHQSDSEPEMKRDSKSNLKELGLKEDDNVVVKLKKMLTFRKMSVDEHQMEFNDDKTVEDLKEKICEKLEGDDPRLGVFCFSCIKLLFSVGI